MYRKLFAWFMTLTMLLSLLPATGLTALAAETTPNYLTFTAEEDNSSVTFNYYDGSNVQTSTDGGNTWEDYSYGTTITLAQKGDQVCFRGNNVETSGQDHFSMTGTIAASGSVTSLTDGNGGNPGVGLSDYCYCCMFFDCTSLTAAPELPATSLAEGCYYNMFYNCSKLTTAPELPAKTLAKGCYESMFDCCSDLTTAPELPAKTLAYGCYSGMFCNTSLTTAPELPVETLEDYCYSSMFSGCTSLTTAPELPAETLAKGCYRSMFSGCSNLTTPPELMATTLASSCYESMFYDCSNLVIYENETDFIWSFPASGAEDWNYDMLGETKEDEGWGPESFWPENPETEGEGSVTGVELGKKYNIYPAHTHTYQYTASGATITGKCSESGCTKTGSYTVSYDSTNQVAVVTGEITGVDKPTPVYYKGDTSLGETAPTEPGDYTAKITVEGATASVNFTISGETPTHSQTTTFENRSKTECENQYLTFVLSSEEGKTYKSPQTIKQIFEKVWDSIEAETITFHVVVTGLDGDENDDNKENVTVDLMN